MYYKYFLVLLFFLKLSDCVDQIQGWNYINLHCRDNENKPVDWWYIYKPPVEIPYSNKGFNFFYITSDTIGQWQESDKSLFANSMLQHTFAPLFRPTYVDYLGVLAYEGRSSDKDVDDPARGFLMADEKGGIWIQYSVPGLLDFNKSRIMFPTSEKNNGHMLSCLSVDLVSLNEIVVFLRQMSPVFTQVQIPEHMAVYLPAWKLLHTRGKGFQELSVGLMTRNALEFRTRNKSLRATLMVRKPGDQKCLYDRFAVKKKLILDVYNHREISITMCHKQYGVRKIEQISTKIPLEVHYINKSKDHASFAVSTAAHWQVTGLSGSKHYWACASSRDDSTNGGVMLCVEDYKVWLSFDRLKIKEPEC